jgi:hypothetical protein
MEKMMCSRIRLAVLAVLALSAGYDPARAQDFVFDVPVDVRSLPALIHHITISCNVNRVDARGAVGVQVGGGAQDASLDRGTFTGRVRVPVRVFEGRHPSEAGAWSCIVSLYDAEGNVYNPFSDSDPDSRFFVPALRRQPGAVIVNQVSGRF